MAANTVDHLIMPLAALARLAAADALDAAIGRLGEAYAEYLAATARLERTAGVELQHHLRTPIQLTLARAGLASFLESRLTGTVPPLRTVCQSQHERVLPAAARDVAQRELSD